MDSYSDVEINTKVQEIIKKIQLALEKLEKSSFYSKFMKQMQNPEMLARIERVKSFSNLRRLIDLFSVDLESQSTCSQSLSRPLSTRRAVAALLISID